jgi:catalase
VNADGAAHFVKFHFRPKLGTHSLVWDEAARIQGADNDYHRRDLWEAIESGAYPEWEMGLQVFTEEEAQKWSFDVLDATKIIPEELVPLRIVGRLVLDRNPDNFFAETEQVAFCTAHVIPGIDFSNDPLLAGRIHSYLDTQITRLGGPNFHEIPINAPLAAVHNNQRDGLRRVAVHRGRVAYEPNSLAGGCPFQGGRATGFVSFPQPAEGEALRGKPEKFAEHYHQATLFWNSQTEFEKAHIVGGFRFELSKVKVPAIRERMVAGLRNVSEELAGAVAEGLGMTDLPPPLPRATERPAPAEVDRSPALSLTAQPGDGSIRTRKVAILVADGVDTAAVKKLSARLQQEAAVPQIVAPRLGKVEGANGDVIDADATLENSPAVLFDALALPGGKAAVEALVKLPATAEFIAAIHRHCKTLLAIGDAQALLESLAIPAALPSGAADEGVLTMAQLSDEGVGAFVDAVARHRHMERERL